VSSPSEADERLSLLGAVGDVADGTLLLGETVQRLLELIVPTLADVATIDVTSGTGEMRRLGARVRNPADPALERGLLQRHQSGDAGVGVLRAVGTSEPQLISPVTDATLGPIATGPEDLALLRALDLRSTMYIPLRARGRVVGVLACSTRGSRAPFTLEDLHFADVLGGRIGLALDNAGLSQAVGTLERRLEATLTNLAAAVLVRDADGGMVFANPAAAELLGADSVEALFSASPAEMMTRFDAFAESGEPLALDDLPSGRAMRGERPEPLVVRSIIRATGRQQWLLHKATPVFDPDGTLALVVNVIEDITDQKRAELAQRMLSEAGRALSSSLDYEQTLQRVARLAVPQLADWCGVSIRGSGDVLRQVAVAHVDPDKVAIVREWGGRWPTRLDAPNATAAVVRTGRPRLVREITDDLLAASEAPPGQIALVRQLEMRSIITVALAVPGRPPFGALTLVMAESGRHFDAEDLAVAEELGRRAGAAVENARLYTERSRLATTLQHSLVPPRLPAVPGFHLATLYRPAGEGSEVGGDFYDVFPVNRSWMVVVGDVTGHGAEAAALTSLSRYTLRTAGRLLGDPVAAVRELNVALLERDELSLVSLCCVVLRPEEDAADVMLAGHPPAYHVSGARASAVGAHAQLLGFDDAGRWSTETVVLAPGDTLVLYTDGVIDTFAASERFGEYRLEQALRSAAGAEDAIARVDAALSAFAGQGAQRDDTALLALERLPVAVSPVGAGTRRSGAG
jgi:PAS domain S-box-containing protein